MKEFLIENWANILVIAWWIIAFLWWVVQFFKAHAQLVYIEKLKLSLEIQKNQHLLNDDKFRKAYESFLGMLFDILNSDKTLNEVDKGMIEFMKVSMLFAWPETIKSFSQYRKGALNSTKEIMLNMEELILCMRKDLWASNTGLSQYDIIQTFVAWDVKKELG